MKHRSKWRIDDEGRECSKCGIFKTWDNFSHNKWGTRRHQAWCTDCFREHDGREKKKEYKITEVGRECSECGIFKPWDEFHIRVGLSTGHASACKICVNARTKRDMLNGSKRNRELVRRYGITLEEYNALVEKQNDSCAICGTNQKGNVRGGNTRYWSVDHDHKTGKVRGLLCQQCNAMLGMAKDNTEVLKRAIDYLCRNDT